MKRILLILTVLLATLVTKAGDPIIKDTTIKNVKYSIYQGSKGGKYIIVTSKTGTQYKKYLPKAKTGGI